LLYWFHLIVQRRADAEQSGEPFCDQLFFQTENFFEKTFFQFFFQPKNQVNIFVITFFSEPENYVTIFVINFFSNLFQIQNLLKQLQNFWLTILFHELILKTINPPDISK
jgi:hypothetical protein